MSSRSPQPSRTPWTLAWVLATCLVAVAGSACGSASETPWPKEPLNREPGPIGEKRVRGNVIDTSTLPDNYNKGEGEDGEGSESSPSNDDDDGERRERRERRKRRSPEPSDDDGAAF